MTATDATATHQAGACQNQQEAGPQPTVAFHAGNYRKPQGHGNPIFPAQMRPAIATPWKSRIPPVPRRTTFIFRKTSGGIIRIDGIGASPLSGLAPFALLADGVDPGDHAAIVDLLHPRFRAREIRGAFAPFTLGCPRGEDQDPHRPPSRIGSHEAHRFLDSDSADGCLPARSVRPAGGYSIDAVGGPCGRTAGRCPDSEDHPPLA